jgi:hypothetical protein
MVHIGGNISSSAISKENLVRDPLIRWKAYPATRIGLIKSLYGKIHVVTTVLTVDIEIFQHKQLRLVSKNSHVVSKKIFQCPFDTLVIISSNVESDL